MKEGKRSVLRNEKSNKLNSDDESMRTWVCWRDIKVKIFIKCLELKVCLGEISVTPILKEAVFLEV